MYFLLLLENYVMKKGKQIAYLIIIKMYILFAHSIMWTAHARSVLQKHDYHF